MLLLYFFFPSFHASFCRTPVPYIPVLSDDGKEVTLTPFTKGDNVIRTVYFPLPRPSLIKDYESKRNEHNMGQLNRLHDSLNPKAKERDGRGKNPNSMKNLIQNRGDNIG